MGKKITVTTGARSGYGILRTLLKEIILSKKLELYLIVAGMHFSKIHGMTINEIKKDGFGISEKVSMTPTKDTSFHTTEALGKGLIQFSKIFKKIKPDINLVLGDRDEALASTLAASHMNIINAHIAGGDKSGGIAEYNRHAITKLSNLHFAVTKKSRNRIIKLGENPKNVFVTGSPAIDEIIQSKITSKKDLETKLDIKITGKEILLVFHPVTTQTFKNKEQIEKILEAISKIKKNTIAIAPNSDFGYKQIYESIENFSTKNKFFKMIPNLPRSDYLGLLKNFGVLVGNSSSGLVEASYFSIPVVNIGIRQQNRESGPNAINISGNSINEIFSSIDKALKTKKRSKKSKNIFGSGNSSKKIVNYLQKDYSSNLIKKQINF